MKTTVIVLLAGRLLASIPLWAEDGPFEQGVDHVKAGEYEEAIQAFSLCIELIPHDYEAFYQRGLAWMLKGDDHRAAADFSKAIELNPNFAPALANRGVIRTMRGDPAGAVVDFSRVLEIAPDNVEVRCNRGAALCERGRCRRALRDYNAALEIDPLSARAHGYKGFALERLGDFAGASVYYRKAIRLEPGDDASRNNLAWIMAACPDERFLDGAEAVRLASEALAINHDPAYLDTLAAAYAEMGLFEEALSTQEKYMTALADKADEGDISVHRERLSLYRSRKPFRFSKKTEPMEALEEEGSIAPMPAASSPPAPSSLAAPGSSEPETGESDTRKSGPYTIHIEALREAPAASSPPAPSSLAAPGSSEPETGGSDTREPRPYTIQIEARRDMEAALGIALATREKGLPSFTSPAHIPRKGKWHRVFVGRFESAPAARKELEMARTLGFSDAFVAKMPFTLRLTPKTPGASLSELEKDLRATGFLPPSPGNGQDSARGIILVGAFETKAVARKSAEHLSEAGFHFEIVRAGKR